MIWRAIAAAALVLTLACGARAAPACPPGETNFPPPTANPALFRHAIARVADFEPSNEKLHGITVPHHLLADRLIALGFRAASGFRYKRIIVIAPDHFRQTEKPFATSARGFDTELGPVEADEEAVKTLVAQDELFEDSCLFAREHGVTALLPFVRHYFPDARIVPVAMSIRSKRADWDRLLAALLPLVDDDTLVVESTDFSHFLPQPLARRHDQQVLNVLAAGDLDLIAGLRQPDHVDSVGALYLQMALQEKIFGARPLVIANESSNAFSAEMMRRTTSYNVIVFGRFGPEFNDPVAPGTLSYFFAGDTNFGRAMKLALLDPDAVERVRDAILERTKGRPLILNLEGVILPNVPEGLDGLTLAMPDDLTIRWLRDLNTVAVSLANNHASDLGETGLEETHRALDAAGIRYAGQGGVFELPGLDVVALTDLDSNALYQTDLITPALLDRLVRPDAAKPVLALVHWGREYVAEPTPREALLADEIRLRGAAAIIGGHPHVDSGLPIALAGGDTAEVYSMGNFLFDQSAARSSGQLVEVRVFPQGTLFLRTLPLPNLFDLAKN